MYLFDIFTQVANVKPVSKGFMDKNTAMLIALGIFALVFIGFFAVFRKKGKGRIKGPFGMDVDVEGANEQPQTRVTGADAGGNMCITESGGRGLEASKLKSGGDMDISSSSGGGRLHPKK